MQEIKDFDKVKAESTFDNLTAGPHVCTILKAEDVSEKQYLRISFDVSQGDFKDYYKNMYLSQKKTNPDAKWHGTDIRSYKETALTFFKGFITAVEKSNPGYEWRWDEKTLAGKQVVINFREEEYVNSKGVLAVCVKPGEYRSLDALKKGEIKIMKPKTLPTSEVPENSIVNPQDIQADDDKLPF